MFSRFRQDNWALQDALFAGIRLGFLVRPDLCVHPSLTYLKYQAPPAVIFLAAVEA